jgi:ubiquinone/menaquinone biosynthesis C-methylase UbiE
MDPESLILRDASFDVVTVLEVLQHVPHPERALAHAVRVARRFVVATSS